CVSSYSLLIGRSVLVLYPLSLHDALPICYCARTLSTLLDRKEIVHSPTSPRSHSRPSTQKSHEHSPWPLTLYRAFFIFLKYIFRSEEHTSELQSRFDLVCHLLLEKKNHKS